MLAEGDVEPRRRLGVGGVGEGAGAGGVAARLGDGALSDDVVVVGAGEDRSNQTIWELYDGPVTVQPIIIF